MPRPNDGYKNAAGQSIPGCTDITGRFKDSRGLIRWAHGRGLEGHEDLYGDGAITIGNCTHMMAEMDLRGQNFDAIDAYLENTAKINNMPYEDKVKVVRCFASYRNWRTSFSIRPVMQETSLVSERYQYGGTPDLIGLGPKGLCLVDLKTCKDGRPYAEHPIQLAGYGRLWMENHPDMPLTGGYHLVLLPKNGSPVRVIEYSPEKIEAYWNLFAAWRSWYDLDRECSKAAALDGRITVTDARARTHAPTGRVGTSEGQNFGASPKPIRKAPDRLSYSPQPPMSMAEIMRAYGHVGAIA